MRLITASRNTRQPLRGASGDLITTSQSGGTTDANVNLGLAGLGLGGVNDALNGVTDPAGQTLDGVNLGDLGGGVIPGGGATPGATQVAEAFGALGSGERQQLRLRCVTILGQPAAFDTSLVALCRMATTIR